MPRVEMTPRRLAVGLALALAFGLGGAWLALAASARGQHQARVSREAVVMVSELAELVEEAGLEEVAGGDGEEGSGVAEVVALFAELHPSATAIRVVHLGRKRLLASTAAGDEAEGPPPRRLTLDEKPLYDLGQELRAAVETNRAEGRAWKPEISVERRSAGGWRLAAPVEADGQVVGAVLVETAPVGQATSRAWVAALVAGAAALGLFALLAVPLRARVGALAVLAAVLFVLAIAGFGRYAVSSLAVSGAAAEASLAAQLEAEADRFERLLAERGAGAADLDPARWDVDLYRQPRAGGAAAEEALLRGRLVRLLVGAGSFALLVGLFVGLGASSRLGATLARYHRAYGYAVPAMVAMVLLVYLPFTYGLALSLTSANVYNTDQPITQLWVGLDNYASILGDFRVTKETPEGRVFDYGSFYWTAGFTVVWTVANVAIGVSVGLLLALILHRKGIALKPIYRIIFILPWAVPNYITALIWRGMFHSQFGVINHAIQLFGGDPVSWFEHPLTSFAAVLATNGWLSFPFMMVISLGALQSIPADLYEAARVDGATAWQQFRSITLPSLKPALVPAIIVSVIWTFNMFNIIYLVSAGQPAGSTEILITQAYKIAFEQYRYGYAAAYATVIFLMLFAYGMWQIRVTRATEGA